MRLSISSFSLRIAIFAGVFLGSATFLEAYCRLSNRFNDYGFSYLREVAKADATNAVFGDSHVGLTSFIPRYAFLGQAGQQPDEFLLLARTLYANRRPERVIVEASPQWFGEYHIGARRLLTPASLAAPKSILGVQVLSLSGSYSGAIFNNLWADVRSALATIFADAHAEVPRPDAATLTRFAAEWQAMAYSATFNWSQFPVEKRLVLTTSRVYSQNPIERFTESEPRRSFEDAITFLLERGAEVCMFRTPVSDDYLKIAKQIKNSRYAEFETYIRAFATSKKLKLIDFRNLSLSFDDTKFFNADHLNNAAAAAMWPLVADACFGS